MRTLTMLITAWSTVANQSVTLKKKMHKLQTYAIKYR